MSFQNIQPGSTTFVGLHNYQKLLSDKTFQLAIFHSFRYMLWTLILLIPLPMIFAVMLNSKFAKCKTVFKSIMYLPALTSVVVAGIIFRLLFSENEEAGMNQILTFFGGQATAWLKNDSTGLFALLLLACWRWMGVNMLYFIAGLNAIDESLYEAASIDGANAWQKFIYITFPLLKPTTVYVITISIYAGLSMFMESMMLWSGNSSPQDIGLTIVGYLYRRGIEKNQFGYASAVGLVLLVIALIINTIQLVLSGTFKKESD
ncbi:MAG: sugar ABC transporter permease [Oscillospiraceae bacterium]|jgi:arabinosaccharide transport system permease protein|nr:sugar ABC transporter permease [Oscillospiraceae bacterium]MDD3260496.1 sugar ABC transporter permease [Oscillospiraceae bacterium]